MKILITGGAGYIGSTVASVLLDNGHAPSCWTTSQPGEWNSPRTHFLSGRHRRPGILERIFSEHPDIQAAIHCAALIVVPESVEKPYEYYRGTWLNRWSFSIT